MDDGPDAVIEVPEKPKRRELVISTDGNVPKVEKCEMSALEVRGIIWLLLKQLGDEISFK